MAAIFISCAARADRFLDGAAEHELIAEQLARPWRTAWRMTGSPERATRRFRASHGLLAARVLGA